MPKDTVYLASLRDPATQLLSAFKYFGGTRCFNTYEEMLSSKNTNTSDNFNKCIDLYKYWLMNGQLYDLGLDTYNLSHNNSQHVQTVLDKISEIDKQFSLVLILERLDESLILMRDLLNWTTEDIIYFRKNFQIRNPDEQPVNYTEVQKSEARKWNWADNLLYLHFKKKLDAKLDKNPSYYKQEVEKFYLKSRQWMTRCVKKVIPASLARNVFLKPGYASNIGTYVLTSEGEANDKCVQLTSTASSVQRLLNKGWRLDAKVYKKGNLT